MMAKNCFLFLFFLECLNVPKEDAFRCLDMCYIAALLHDGLGLDKTAILHVSHLFCH